MIIGPETIEFSNLDTLVKFTGYKEKVQTSVPEGLELAKDVINSKGGVLYAKETVIDEVKITRLRKILEMNPDINFEFSFRKNDKLISSLKKIISRDFKRIIDSRKVRGEYRKLMDRVSKAIDLYFDSIFSNPELVYFLYRLKLVEASAAKEGVPRSYFHTISVCLFSLGIMQNMGYVSDEKFGQDDFIKLGQAALLHDAGGIEKTPDFTELKIEERKKRYFEANKGNFDIVKKIGLPVEVAEVVDNVRNFHEGKKDFMEQTTRLSMYSCIIITADLFDLMISGLFDNHTPPKTAVDMLYVKATNREIKKIYVDALAKGLKFGNLFDFYFELERLIKSCEADSARPYPMTGMMSPVLFVCSKNIVTCKEFVSSVKSITIFKDRGGLEEGSYGRCDALSDLLVEFYQEHYGEIKDEVKQKELDKLKSNN